MKHRFVRFGQLLVMALLASGCSAAQSPNTLPTPSSVPQSSAERVFPAPTLPTAATTMTRSGGIAFTRYAIAVINNAYSTGDTTALEQISAPDCRACQNNIQGLTKDWSNGGSVKGGQLTPISVELPVLSKNVVITSIVVTDISEQVTSSKAGVSSRVPAIKSRTYYFDLEWDGRRWLLSNIRKPMPT